MFDNITHNHYFISTGIIFMGYFAIMNPLTGIPIFLTLTENETKEETRKIAFQGVLTAFLIVLVFAFAGNLILKCFGISLTALRLTGGVIVGIIGYDMLQGRQSSVKNPSKETIEKSIKEENSVAVAPLGIPLLAGPGVIITTMNFASGSYANLIITVLSFGVLCIMTYYAFLSGRKIREFLGISALRVTTRMMGLILSVIGTQMLIQGIYSAVKEFA